MLPPGPAPLLGTVLGHPLTQPFELPISPLVAAAAGAAAVLAVAFAVPRAPPGGPVPPDRELTSWDGPLSRSQLAGRVVGAALLLLAVTAGRLGEDDELENLAPALVVGAAWPLLVLASIALGPVWRWLDPWDGIARAVVRREPDEPPRHVWPAALLALPWVWYLSAYPDSLAPRSVGAILAIYTLLTLAGCLAFGRRRWLGSSEPLGIVLSWLARLPQRRLADWDPPRGAEVLLGVLAGGLLFGAARRSELWGGLNAVRGALLLATLGALLSAAAAAGLLLWTARLAEQLGARAAAARAAVPAVAGIVVAVAMDRNRVLTSLQLLPELLGDPFGRGWDLFGRTGAELDPAPLGTRGLLVTQLSALVGGHVAGAVVLARRVGREARGPVALGLSILAAGSVIALASH